MIRQREREFAVSTGLMQVKFAISVRLLQVVQEREVFDQTKFAVSTRLMQGKFAISMRLLQIQYRREKYLIRQSSRLVDGKCKVTAD